MSKSYARSFAGGEISALLTGRLDLAKNQTGLAKCLNWLVTPQGPIENRPGFAYVLKTRYSSAAVLIPFVYNTDQSFALELGDQYVRFHTAGGTLLETGKTITGITQAAPGVFTSAAHGFSNLQWVFLSGIGGMSALNGRWGVVQNATTNTFTLLDLWGEPIDTTDLPAFTSGGTAARVYEISTPYLAADLFDLHYVQSADVLTITHQGYNPMELRRLSATNWTLTAVSFAPTLDAPDAPDVTAGGPGGGTPVSIAYVTTGIAAGTQEESLASPSSSVSIDLTVKGNNVLVVTQTVAGAFRYNIYKSDGGSYGFIGQSDGTSFSDRNITPDTSKTPPLLNNPFSGENPRAVSYFQQRRCFGGGSLSPQNVWMTRSGTESSMTYSIPTQDDDSISLRIVAREANTVRHLVPAADLLALTSSGVWRLASDSGVITPATIAAKPQSNVGASNVQPMVTSQSVLYVQARGSHVREVRYQWETQQYQADDISVLAPHLFDGRSITQLAYTVAPYQVLWATRDDGTLLGMTHQPEHQVEAWHQHSTPGLFKSICAIPEGTSDGVYAIVQRTINGQTISYVERMSSRQFAALADAFFVDSGVSYSGAPASTITGLWHLEGEAVSILADGGVVSPRTVTGGQITLDAPASKVQAGLGYNCDAQSLPLVVEQAQAFGQSVQKNVSQAWLRFYQSGGVQAGPTFDKLRDFQMRSVSDDYGTPPALTTGVGNLSISPQWQQDGAICIRQANPLPTTLVAMTLETAIGG